MNSLEVDYNNLQTIYFRLRTQVQIMRGNETKYKEQVRQYEQRLHNEQERYRVLNENSKKELRM